MKCKLEYYRFIDGTLHLDWETEEAFDNMPFVVKSEHAAKIIATSIARDEGYPCHGKWNRITNGFQRIMSDFYCKLIIQA